MKIWESELVNWDGREVVTVDGGVLILKSQTEDEVEEANES
jgi:hypothetical protein